MATQHITSHVALCDAFNEALCKLKALELLLSSQPLQDALDEDAAAGVSYLFSDVVHEFEALHLEARRN